MKIKLINYFKNYWIETLLLGLIAIFIIVVALLPLINDHHWLYNLEPYPDSLFYLFPPRNLILTGHWALLNAGTIARPLTPPLYSLIQIPWLLIWNHPASFVLGNCLLSVLAILAFFGILTNLKVERFSKLLLTVLFISQALFWWLVNLPMTENLGLCLFLWSIQLMTEKLSLKKTLALALLIIGLVTTKFIYVFPAAMLTLWFLIEIWSIKKWSWLGLFILIGTLGATVFLGYQQAMGMNPLLFFQNFSFLKFTHNTNSLNQVVTTAKDEPTFFSGRYASDNLGFYLAALLGSKTVFLWLSINFSNAIISFLVFMGSLIATIKRQNIIIWLWLLMLIQLPLMLIFNTHDVRYVWLTWPLLILMISLLDFKNRFYLLKNLLIFVAILGQVLVQKSLWREILSANLLHRSRAWQYESIKHADGFLKNKSDAIFITALPPHLITSYSQPQYRIMPLSNQQEFKNKPNTWGSDYNFNDLPSTYKKWLTESKKIYISNAYITHQAIVINDFEQYKREFDLQLVSSGCDNACNIYQLTLPSLDK